MIARNISLLFMLAGMITSVAYGKGTQQIMATKPTYINEFPHPRLAVHFHPTTEQFKLADLQYALNHKVHAAELDLHLRDSDGQVVCNHNEATPVSPTLTSAINLIISKKGLSSTVNGDGRQFFLVLEPKENSGKLFDEILRVLNHYKSYLSTSATKLAKPRGITVVITGSFVREFYAYFAPEAVNQLCIVETHNYADEIIDLAQHKQVFQWVSIRHSQTYGEDCARVCALHNGTDSSTPGKFNVRIWDCHKDLKLSINTGADSLNCDRDEIEEFLRVLSSK